MLCPGPDDRWSNHDRVAADSPYESGRRLDVLYVGTLPPHPGGSAILAGQILEGLVSHGHRVRAISGIPDGLGADSDPAGVEVTRFAVPWFEMSPDQPAPDAYRAAEGRGIRTCFDELVGRARPDVVIAGREVVALHVAELCDRYDLPSVLWVQGGALWGIQRGTLPESHKRNILSEMARVDRIVAVADHLLGPLAELGMERAVAIRNGVDTKRFRPGPRDPALLSSLGVPAGCPIVLHASNMKAIKRPLDLAAAAEVVAERDPSVRWVIVGDGPTLPELKARCRDLGLSELFRFIGWVDHDQMPAWIRLAEAVVMPSAAEAMALIYLETLATGRVLVASDIPAAREVIESGVDGLIFPVGDSRALAEAVLRATSDAGLREALGSAALERARANDMSSVVVAHAAVLLDVARA